MLNHRQYNERSHKPSGHVAHSVGRYEAGIGLIEVLVSLLVLAVAVLGFSALQMRVSKTTEESLMRADALMVVRNISESMRLYPDQLEKFKNAINPTAQKAIAQAMNSLSNSQPTSPVPCVDNVCTREQEATRLANEAMITAYQIDVKLNALDCPTPSNASRDVIKKVCLIASWGNTNPTMGGGDNDCIDNSGAYQPRASCFVMETY